MHNERHAFIDDGSRISREAFVEAGIKETTTDKHLMRFIHAHKWAPTDDYTCNARCIVIEQGKVTQVEQSTTQESPVV